MSPLLAIAALLAFSLGVAHSWLGERYILIRLFRRELPKLFGDDWFTRRVLRFAWHLTTLAWWGLGAILLLAARQGPSTDPAVLRIVAGTFALSGAVTLLASRGRHLAWIVFLTIAALVWSAV